MDVNDRVIDPRVYAEMLDHIILLQDVAFASRYSYPQLMEYFLAAMMEVGCHLVLDLICDY